ncbi:LTA synthase family protein [Fructobacillus papyrifericola]|uniref:LTA synthase family protein n=1 Tax=Fructobacillus papyrifericola TaxID=2713172 RepID=A0ABS5QVB4_9LACO|nr:LTA synthase family protein [Fructobacillus papyrifericola]MBS9336737.1 LTA synthase family protein [Fructobacillus papyrifericola]
MEWLQKQRKRIQNGLTWSMQKSQTRLGFYCWMVFLLWAKTIFAYGVDFHWMHAANPYQFFLVLINPLGFTFFVMALPLFFKKRPLFYGAMLTLNALLTTFLYLNVVYYREFTDFMSVNTILTYSSVNQGAKAGGAVAFDYTDIFFWVDLIVILYLLFRKKIKMDGQKTKKGRVALYLMAAFTFMMGNLVLADIDRPQLLTRQFDRVYLVKYLGLGPFMGLDAYNTFTTSQVRKAAKPDELATVQKYVNEHYAGMNSTYAGKAKGKNVIVIHLESFQQFSIDRKVNGQEVTPFLNSLYHSKDSLSFDNFFHEVGQGKTSDAENMLETSTFGLPQGSLFAKLGNDQTFQAMPAILNQRAGYSSAVFHGNNGSFWNRTNVYKNMGYQNWISGEYFDSTGKRATAWGLKDKLLFKDSIPYLEQLQHPFYAKYLTVTNHTPFELDKEDQDPNFQTSNSGSKYIDNYFVTNHYLDQSIQEFFTYLKKSGLYDNTMVVLYGDHYGINNSENKELAPLLGKDPNQWTDLDTENLQRTPLIIHIPGFQNGGIQHTYGGEIDVAPTIEHLLGLSSKRYIQLGQDLLSKNCSQLVVMRNKDWITPNYASISGTIWNVKTNTVVEKPTEAQQKLFKKLQAEATEKLSVSDSLNQKNLLRFYHPEGFKDVNAASYDYSKKDTLARLKKASQISNSTSVFSKNGGQTTAGLYQTNAPEQNATDNASVSQSNK